MTLLTAEELRKLRTVRPWRAASSIVFTWAVILASFALYLRSPSVLTALVAGCLIASRHMALAVLMHEGAHYLLHPNRVWNDRISQWLCGYPLFIDTLFYREVHFRHHRHTWSEKDPDLSLADHYPVSPGSLVRRVLRD